ncbi:hypothetical protein [[Phormidium] sp. ETS-05]|nr:hypothetical protein [[Phormidium] sp. ETS-05]
MLRSFIHSRNIQRDRHTATLWRYEIDRSCRLGFYRLVPHLTYISRS